MARLIYSAIASLDGYVADENGKFDWAEPDDEVHGFVNELSRPLGAYLLGRRMYEVLSVWDTMNAVPDEPAVIYEFAEIWLQADKIVYSRTLAEPATERTRIERAFEPEAIRRMKAEAAHDLAIAGPELAGQAFAAGLVDELQLFLAPVIVGGGNRALPEGVRLRLELIDERRFQSGFVFLHYLTT